MWSKAHPTAPCPTAKDLALALSDDHALDDAWGRRMTVTCTAQPGDQVIGLTSAGTDGIAGNTDDVASWDLGHELTDLVHGPRWAPIVVKAPSDGPRSPVTLSAPLKHTVKLRDTIKVKPAPTLSGGDGIPDVR